MVIHGLESHLIFVKKYNVIVYNTIKYIFSVEAVRESVQPNWPDAETGVPPEEVKRECSVISNYFDKGM